MKREDADFWKDMLLENADYLFRKKLAQRSYFSISMEELIQETINHVTKILQNKIPTEIKGLLTNLLHEECIGISLWKIKEGYIIPGYYLADIFLKKAKELFSEESRRYKSVLSMDEVIEVVMNQFNALMGGKIDAQTKADLYRFLEKLCNEDKYFKKIQEKYIIFDKNGKDRLEKIDSST
jgi:hypothetical protein